MSDQPDKTCGICLDPVTQGIACSQCHHTICRAHLHRLASPCCPYCRTTLTVPPDDTVVQSLRNPDMLPLFLEWLATQSNTGMVPPEVCTRLVNLDLASDFDVLKLAQDMGIIE